MTVQQWRLTKIPEPRTLADVPSSREKPVLCWNRAGDRILRAFVQGCMIRVLHSCGFVEDYENSENASKFPLYTQPSRPTKLEDVPDRRIVYARFSSGLECLLFREFDTWHGIERGERFSDSYMRGQDNGETPVDWQLTDHVAELVETEIGVVE